MVNLEINSDIISDVKLAIFDKDGTLMDLYHYWSQMVSLRVELARKELGFSAEQKEEIMYAMGVNLQNRKLRDSGPVGLKKREIVMQAMIDSLDKLGFNDTHNLCFDIFKEADRISQNCLGEMIKPVNGMHQLISLLHKKGCGIAVATTDKTERAKLALRFLGISDKVSFVVGEDMVQNYKPYPDMINLVLERLSIDKNNAVMVGDAITDVEMGLNAGVKAAIGVCSGLASKEALMEKTRYVAEDISHIKIA
ncbi:MAG: HAD family hydrolase [bacterium]